MPSPAEAAPAETTGKLPSGERLQREIERLAAEEAKKEKRTKGIHLRKEYITAETWAAIEKKKKTFEAWQRNRSSDALHGVYEKARDTAKKMVRWDNNERFRKWSGDVQQAFDAGRFDDGFRALRAVYKPKPRRGGITRDRSSREALTVYTDQLLNATTKPPVQPTILNAARAATTIADGVPDDEELEKALARLRDTAPGGDGVRARWIRKNKEMKRRVFQEVKEAWRDGIVPQAWRKATMVMIEKKTGATKWEDHRGITLLSVPGKLAMRVLLQRTRNVELLELQHGFRHQRSTTGPIALIKNLTQQARKRRTEVVLAYVDITKAYDSVDREFLWRCMEEYGFGPKAIQLVRATYDDEVAVKLDGVTHDRSFKTTRGLRQGCLLSPFLFNMVIDKVFRTLQPKLEGVQ